MKRRPHEPYPHPPVRPPSQQQGTPGPQGKRPPAVSADPRRARRPHGATAYPVEAAMIAMSTLRDIPEETANRMMMVSGSSQLLRALRGEPEPIDIPEPAPSTLAMRLSKRPARY